MKSEGGVYLRELRERKDISQKELAGTSTLSQPYISGLERGDRDRPGEDALKKISDALDLDEKERVSLQRAFYPSAIQLPPERDQTDQAEADEVWVVAQIPAEFRDENYRRVVCQNLTKGVKYFYWTTEPLVVERILQLIREELTGTEMAVPLDELVHCIVPPRQASWFNFVIYQYDTDAGKSVRGRVSFGPATKGANLILERSVEMDPGTVDRIYRELREVYDRIQIRRELGEMSPKTSDDYQYYQLEKS